MNHREILSKMSLEEKIAFCSGASFWQTKAYPQLGIPALFLCDGPHGLRKQNGLGDHLGLEASVTATCFPTAGAAAATWDTGLLRRMGEAIGLEAAKEQVHVVLGPGVNMKRNPLCGRNFEYYSEDPWLSGKLAAAWISGVQSRGVGTSLKHFAANNQEEKRMSGDSLVDERALREYYLPAFEIAVKESHPATVMCAYNRLNGLHCSDSKRLLWDILRQEWGFEGAVLTDWGATNRRIDGFQAGLDLEMPGSRGRFDKEVKAAVVSGALDESLIDDAVRRLLRLIENTRGHSPAAWTMEQEEIHHELARDIAAAGGILLKNDGAVLPLAAEATVTVLGALAETPRYQGMGSSLVRPRRLLSLLDGLRSYTSDVSYCAGYRLEDVPDTALLSRAKQAAAEADCLILCLGLSDICESEGYDRKDLSLPTNQLALLKEISSLNENIIVVLVGGAPVEMPWLDDVRALLHMQLAGQAGGQAAADLLFGAVNPSGKLTETYPLCYGDVVSSPYYGKNPRQFPCYESMYNGYRYFDAAGMDVLFPFGYGLSYTSFAYHDLAVTRRDDHRFDVTFRVENTGAVDGAEVAQLYVRPKTEGAYRPVQELKAFEKVFLRAGDSSVVTLSLAARSFAIYDPKQRDWVVEAGDYEIAVGGNSRALPLKNLVTLTGRPPRRDDCSPWYYRPVGSPDKSDFVTVYGDYIDERAQRKGQYDMSNSILEMSETSLFCRLLCKLITMKAAQLAGGKANDYNAQFKMLRKSSCDTPLRALPLFNPGIVTYKRVRFILDVANGHPLKGLVGLLKP